MVDIINEYRTNYMVPILNDTDKVNKEIFNYAFSIFEWYFEHYNSTDTFLFTSTKNGIIQTYPLYNPEVINHNIKICCGHFHNDVIGAGGKINAINVLFNTKAVGGVNTENITVTPGNLKSLNVKEALEELNLILNNRNLPLINEIGYPANPQKSLTELKNIISDYIIQYAQEITKNGVHVENTVKLDAIKNYVNQIRFDGVKLISDAQTSDVLVGKTYIDNTALLAGGSMSIPSKGVFTFTGSKTEQIIPAGLYYPNSKVNKEVNLIPSNIKTNVSIFDVNGTAAWVPGVKINDVLDKTKLTPENRVSNVYKYMAPEAITDAYIEDMLNDISSPYHGYSIITLYSYSTKVYTPVLLNTYLQYVKDLPNVTPYDNIKASSYNQLTLYYLNKNKTAVSAFNKNNTSIFTYDVSSLAHNPTHFVTQTFANTIENLICLNDGSLYLSVKIVESETVGENSPTGNKYTNYRGIIKIDGSGNVVWTQNITDLKWAYRDTNNLIISETDAILSIDREKTNIYLLTYAVYSINSVSGASTKIIGETYYDGYKIAPYQLFKDNNNNFYFNYRIYSTYATTDLMKFDSSLVNVYILADKKATEVLPSGRVILNDGTVVLDNGKITEDLCTSSNKEISTICCIPMPNNKFIYNKDYAIYNKDCGYNEFIYNEEYGYSEIDEFIYNKDYEYVDSKNRITYNETKIERLGYIVV